MTSEVWLTHHKHPTGNQYAIFYDPIPKHLSGAVRVERLDTRKDWSLLKKGTLTEVVAVVFPDAA